MVRTVKSFTKIETARIAALLVLAALVCAGVQAAAAAEQTLTMSIGDYANIGTDPTLDEKIWTGIGGVQDHHYYTHWEPLISFDNDGKIIPWLAESYDVSNDHRTITFHLRKGVKFADGTPLNASILKFNFDRIITYGWKDSLANRSKSNPFVYYDYSEAPDEYTFKIHFTKGWLDMPFNFCQLSAFGVLGRFISPLDVNPAWDIKGMLKPEMKYNGLGPYYVDDNESIPNQKIVLKRRHSWRDDLNFHKPKLDKIVFILIKDPQVAVMALEKGEIDYICRYWNAPLDVLPRLEKNSDISIKTNLDARMYLLRTAFWRDPFNGSDGILMRKAINYALNRTEMIEGAFNGYAMPATDSMWLSLRRPDIPECCNKGYDYNIDKAKQLLSDAGWKDTDGDGILDKNGETLKDLDLVITSASYLVWQKDLALFVQSQLKKIGIDVKIRTLESSDYSKAMKEGEFDLGMTYTMGRSNPLSVELRYFNLQKQGAKTNWYENQNGTLVTITDTAQETANKEERDSCICQMCDILYEEAGVIPLVSPMDYAVMNKKIKGFVLGPTSALYQLDHLEETSISG